MSEDIQQNQTPEQKIIRLEEGVVPPRIVLPDVDIQKGMVPITFIPPTVQQTAQMEAGQAPEQTINTLQSTVTQQTQTPEHSQSSQQSSQESNT